MPAGNWLSQMALWMAERNGRSVAQTLFHKLEVASQDPGGSAVELWRAVLEKRPGWQRVKEGVYRFRTGEQVEMKPGETPRDWLPRITQVEVSPLAKGLSETVRAELNRRAAEAAISWWEQHQR